MEQVYIFLANGFEEIEALTVVDILRRAHVKISMVSLTKQRIVTGAHGIEVQADCFIDEVHIDDVNMIVLPGGMPGTRYLMEHDGLVELLLLQNQRKKWISAICAAPLVLFEHGILHGKRIACYKSVEQQLTGCEVVQEAVVIDGNLITSRGLGTALDFALTILTVLRGEDAAKEQADSILYQFKQ